MVITVRDAAIPWFFLTTKEASGITGGSTLALIAVPEILIQWLLPVIQSTVVQIAPMKESFRLKGTLNAIAVEGILRSDCVGSQHILYSSLRIRYTALRLR